ncbi:MAG: hypothetical protein ACRC3H_07665, partial [Lachnospiraceae bacterium]
MKAVWTMTLRTIKLYLKNPLSLLFSFVYMLLIMSLFGLFLGEYMANGMKEVYSEVQGINLDAMLALVNASAMAGVLMINCILVPLNVLTIMVQDNTDKRINSFLVSSISRDKLVFGYWLAPFIVCVIIHKESIIFRADKKEQSENNSNCSECDSFQLYQVADVSRYGNCMN